MQEGKKTVLTVHFLDHASDAQKQEFLSVYGDPACNETQLLRVQELLRETGSYQYAQSRCKQYADEASAVIGGMQVDAKYREILQSMLDYLCGRNV